MVKKNCIKQHFSYYCTVYYIKHNDSIRHFFSTKKGDSILIILKKTLKYFNFNENEISFQSLMTEEIVSF